MSISRIKAKPARNWALISIAAIGLLIAEAAVAGSFSVSPVRIYMQSRERATAITIVNEAETELVMQAELFLWKQKPDGTDELTPTDDLVLAPPILKVAPKSRQVVRLANLRPVMPGEQRTYRMVVREIPEAQPKPAAGAQVQIALAFSLPVFITPPDARKKLTCNAEQPAPGALVAVCENQGQAYAQPVTIELTNGAGEVLASKTVSGGYILPQVKRTFELSKGSVPIKGGPAKLAVTQDDGSKQIFDVQLAE
jgi:fimbrial chaperone protein